MFASGLAVMLRSQGIPARMAIGFYGGSFEAESKIYSVTGGHAHAWVEAYDHTEFCTEEMFANPRPLLPVSMGCGLDATPPSDLRDQIANAGDTINLAQLLAGFVMRMDKEHQPSLGGHRQARLSLACSICPPGQTEWKG